MAFCSVLGPPPDAFQAYLGESSVAATLAMYYALNLVRAKDKNGVMRVLGYLATTHRFRAYDDPFLHTLVRNQLKPNHSGT